MIVTIGSFLGVRGMQVGKSEGGRCAAYKSRIRASRRGRTSCGSEDGLGHQPSLCVSGYGADVRMLAEERYQESSPIGLSRRRRLLEHAGHNRLFSCHHRAAGGSRTPQHHMRWAALWIFKPTPLFTLYSIYLNSPLPPAPFRPHEA